MRLARTGGCWHQGSGGLSTDSLKVVGLFHKRLGIPAGFEVWR